MDLVEKTVKEIKNFKIQGQTSIVFASLLALKESKGDLREEVRKLLGARPTEPMLKNCLNLVLQEGRERIDCLLEEIKKEKEEIIKFGGELRRKKMKIMTYCHSSTVVSVLKKFKKEGVDLEVVVCETRPLYQGRITAKELAKAGIKTVMVVDGAAGYLLSKENFSGIFLGTDGLTDDYFYNKIGSYGVSLAGYENKVGVYVFGSLLKYTKRSLKIEERCFEEVWKEKPKGVEIFNLAFDKTPYKYVKKIVTEKGVILPEKIGKLALDNYSFIE